MELDVIKNNIINAAKLLHEYNLECLSWGNISSVTEDRNKMAIKASGTHLSAITKDNLVVVDRTAAFFEGMAKASVDLAIHQHLYECFLKANSVVHVHSRWATTFAQARLDIPVIGTTHADFFNGSIPCTRELTKDEINANYELNIGRVIVETFRERKIDPEQVSAVLVSGHGPFAWGNSALEAAKRIIVLEEISFMAWHSIAIGCGKSISSELINKHYNRMNGKKAYYGLREDSHE